MDAHASDHPTESPSAGFKPPQLLITIMQWGSALFLAAFVVGLFVWPLFHHPNRNTQHDQQPAHATATPPAAPAASGPPSQAAAPPAAALPAGGHVTMPAEDSTDWSDAVPLDVPNVQACDTQNYSARQWHDPTVPVTGPNDGHWHDWPTDGSQPIANAEHFRGRGHEPTILYFSYQPRSGTCH